MILINLHNNEEYLFIKTYQKWFVKRLATHLERILGTLSLSKGKNLFNIKKYYKFRKQKINDNIIAKMNEKTYRLRGNANGKCDDLNVCVPINFLF